jgi:hypothetical protein
MKLIFGAKEMLKRIFVFLIVTLFMSPLTPALAVTTSGPPAPRITIITAVASNAIVLEYSASSGADGYYIYRATVGANNVPSQYVNITPKATQERIYRDEGVKPLTTYLYTVCAFYYRDGNVTYGPRSAPVKILSGPTVPEISVTVIDTTTVRLNIKKAAQGADGYEIYFKKSTELPSQVVYLKDGKTSYTRTGLITGVQYSFLVRAYRDDNGVRNFGSLAEEIFVTPKAATVRDLKATPLQSGIQLSWSASKGASGYEIYKADSVTKKYVLVKTVTKNSFGDANVSKGVTYYYKIKTITTVNKKKLTSSFSNAAVAKF